LFVGIVLPHESKPVNAFLKRSEPEKVTEIMRSSIRTMVVICGWVMLFRIILKLFDSLLFKLPSVTRVTVYGILELSNGCIALGSIDNEYTRFIMASAFLSLGGICVLLQTWSVTERIGLGLYIPGKLLHTLFSITVSSVIGSFIYDMPLHIPGLITTLSLSLGLALLFRKKSSSIICANTV